MNTSDSQAACKHTEEAGHSVSSFLAENLEILSRLFRNKDLDNACKKGSEDLLFLAMEKKYALQSDSWPVNRLTAPPGKWQCSFMRNAYIASPHANRHLGRCLLRNSLGLVYSRRPASFCIRCK